METHLYIESMDLRLERMMGLGAMSCAVGRIEFNGLLIDEDVFQAMREEDPNFDEKLRKLNIIPGIYVRPITKEQQEGFGIDFGLHGYRPTSISEKTLDGIFEGKIPLPLGWKYGGNRK